MPLKFLCYQLISPNYTATVVPCIVERCCCSSLKKNSSKKAIYFTVKYKKTLKHEQETTNNNLWFATLFPRLSSLYHLKCMVLKCSTYILLKYTRTYKHLCTSVVKAFTGTISSLLELLYEATIRFKWVLCSWVCTFFNVSFLQFYQSTTRQMYVVYVYFFLILIWILGWIYIQVWKNTH